MRSTRQCPFSETYGQGRTPTLTNGTGIRLGTASHALDQAIDSSVEIGEGHAFRFAEHIIVALVGDDVAVALVEVVLHAIVHISASQRNRRTRLSLTSNDPDPSSPSFPRPPPPQTNKPPTHTPTPPPSSSPSFRSLSPRTRPFRRA